MIMTQGPITITFNSTEGMERGMSLSLSGGMSAPTICWILARKNLTELEVASSWRQSPWVLWFVMRAWLIQRWEALRLLVLSWEAPSRRDYLDGRDDPGSEENHPVLIAPVEDDAPEEFGVGGVDGDDDARGDTERFVGFEKTGLRKTIH